MGNSIKFLGVRGSQPAPGEMYRAYGEDTSCYAVTMGNTTVIVDCGTGITKAGAILDDMSEIHILITHCHLDHIMGLFNLITALDGRALHIYGRTYNGLTIADQIKRLVGPPIWPVTLETVNQLANYHDITDMDEFNIGQIQVQTAESNHPGGSTLYRLAHEGHSVVIAADFNHADGAAERLASFAKDTDLLIYDGSMTTGQYALYNDWGHSTAEAGADIAKAANAKFISITHHGPHTSDDELDLREHDLRSRYNNMFFAYHGLTMSLDNPVLPGYCSVGKSNTQDDRLQSLMEISVNLTSEKDQDRLFELILRSAMEATGADGGTLYSMENHDALYFKVMITKSQGIFQGGKGDPIQLPPVKLSLANVCAASAITKKMIRVEDVYNSDMFDFSGPKDYDKLTGYKSKSMMVAPMLNVSGEVLGVLQLINATDMDGRIVPFTKQDEKMVEAIASQAGISISNITYAENITGLLTGFVRGISTGIDARTPYNANHTRNMVAYANAFIDYQNTKLGPYAMSDNEKQELTMAIWLHDIGKLVTPLSVMDKDKRLTPEHLHSIQDRFGRRELLIHLQNARGEISDHEKDLMLNELQEERSFILAVNNAGFLPNDQIRKLRQIAHGTYRELNGIENSKLTEDELHELSIQKGTLTAEERVIMQNHVVVTSRMLSMLKFPKSYSHVANWASTHHEFLDGTGYPDHLTAKDLSWPARLITILDIFEALTAADRPYRKSMTVMKAMNILQEMVDEGKLDGDILDEFRLSDCWVETLRLREIETPITLSDWQKMD